MTRGGGSETSFRTIRVVWLAMVGGTLLYTIVAYVLLSADVVQLESVSPDIMNAVGALVIVQLAGSLLLRRRMVSSIPGDLPREARLNRYFTASIIALALIEGGGLLLITFSLVTGVATWALVGGGSSVVLMLMARPTEAELDG